MVRSRWYAMATLAILFMAAMVLDPWKGEAVAAPEIAPTALAAQDGVRVGDPAPDFTLVDQDRQEVSLSQFRGQTVQLAFYVAAFSPA